MPISLLQLLGKPGFSPATILKKVLLWWMLVLPEFEDPKKAGFRLQGDVDFDTVAPKCSFITPVPGGVGPMTIAGLLQNTLMAARKEITILKSHIMMASTNSSRDSMLPVMEAFYTIQGEGFYTGHAAYFVRLAGCDVGCVWCDVKESWDVFPNNGYPLAGLLLMRWNIPPESL
jgi:hypothetical protein